ncbi:uncharacterized protein LOC130998926 [Salvia miltiorrhiza]|uniref:uncharacterized protein LOC130998926 n=1 Tax=Salvia miltiorrhiza TaxID=226208 RepID=UPI0025AB871F|nr:uncharacterized protein LOC130998926 [Salvia miltiorrhiza]
MEEMGTGVKSSYIDSTETVQPVVLVNEPGYVAAVGGIPNHLKIEGGMSYGIRFPISMYPKNLPEDPTERRRVFFEIFEKRHAQKMPQRACLLCEQLLPEEYFIVRINSSGPHPSEFYDSRAPKSIPSQSMEEKGKGVKQSIPSQSMEEKGKGVKRSYIDSTETVQPVVLVNEPGYVAAVGGIPDHLKIEGGMSYGIRFPISMYPKNLPEDPTERRRVFFETFEKRHAQKMPRRACSLCKQTLLEEYFIVNINSSGPYPSEFYDSCSQVHPIPINGGK